MKNKINCPICDDICKLIQDYNDIQFPGRGFYYISVDFSSYKCDSCGESFTTREVDEVNLERIYKGIRNYKRKDKINNIIK